MLSCVWIIFLVSIIFKNIPNGISNWWFWVGYPLGLFVFLLVNYILVNPHVKLFENINKNSFIAICIFLILFPILIYPIGQFLADKSMYILKLGGGYKAIFYLEKDMSNCMPVSLIDEKDKNSTKPVFVFLNIGETKYVSLTNESYKKIYGIKSKNITAEIIIPEL